jgi:hypothetical protein
LDEVICQSCRHEYQVRQEYELLDAKIASEIPEYPGCFPL